MRNTNKSDNAYGLTALIPIQNKSVGGRSYGKLVRDLLQDWPLNERSPMAKVPNTYLCRFYLLNDVFYEGGSAREEHLKSKYIVFSSNFHGDLEPYLKGMWNAAGEELRGLLGFCVGFENVVNTADDFVRYIKRCQVNNSLFFNGSTGDPLKEQLKALYLKQAFSYFVFSYQPLVQQGKKSAAELQKAFQAFVEFVQPDNLDGPTWVPGCETEPDGLEATIKQICQTD